MIAYRINEENASRMPGLFKLLEKSGFLFARFGVSQRSPRLLHCDNDSQLSLCWFLWEKNKQTKEHNHNYLKCLWITNANQSSVEFTPFARVSRERLLCWKGVPKRKLNHHIRLRLHLCSQVNLRKNTHDIDLVYAGISIVLRRQCYSSHLSMERIA